MPISNTPTRSPFPLNQISQDPSHVRYDIFPTAENMRKTVLFGLPLKSAFTNEPVTDEAIDSFISEAVSELEHQLDLYITPVEFYERHDYSRHMNTFSFGYLKLNHTPILDVSKYRITFNNGMTTAQPLVDIPLEFVHVQPQDGTVQIVPAHGVTISGLLTSVYSGLGYHAFNSQVIGEWPGAVEITYRAGFEKNKIPALLSGLIRNMAAYKLLSIMGPLIFPYNSVSVSIDGTSQSSGTPGASFLQNRLGELEKIIASQLDAARGYYQKKFIIDVI